MKGYKAFEKGLVCRGKQYQENTVFEEEKAEICNSGMHFCKNPLDVLDHYPFVNEKGEISEFAKVEALDEALTDDNKKYCTKKLKIGAKISFAQLVQASVEFELENGVKENSKDDSVISSKARNAKIGSSGDYAQITSEGKYAVVCCAGHNSVARGKVGSWLTLSEWEFDDKEKAYIPVCVRTEKIDGERIKEDVYYKLINGEFVR